MLTILAVIAALFVGAAIGMLVMALCVAGKREPAPDLTKLSPDSVYVLQMHHEITRQEAEYIRETWAAAAPEGTRIIVLDGRYRLADLTALREVEA